MNGQNSIISLEATRTSHLSESHGIDLKRAIINRSKTSKGI